KRYLKNHISLNTESMVKFLITGVVAFSLTACGGGGGGGSSESAPIPPVVEEVVLPEKNKTVTLNGQNVNLIGSMTIDKNNSQAVGVMATNSNVISKASITIEGRESVALYGTVDKTTLNSKAIYTITNDGDIKISGKNSVGMLVENGVLGVNKGQIRLEETDTIGMVAQNGSIVQNDGVITGFGTGMLAKGASEAQNNGSIELESLRYEGDKIVDEYLTQNERLSKVTGLKATGENSVAINNKDIKVSGYGVGIEVDEKAKGLNSGYIEMSSEAVDSTYNWGENIKGVSYSEIVGMEAKSAEIENGENGKIYLHGRAIGMKATENSIAKNNGEIILEAKYETTDFTSNDGIEDKDYVWSSIAGMFADNSTIENNGKIIHINDGQGMKAQNNSKAINNGDIVLTSVISNENGDYVGWDYHVIGMELKDSVGENNGNIVI
ncbi:MAG: hypothetical protein ACRC92_00820, partial [Peptostreptococcaceae bacterium]